MFQLTQRLLPSATASSIPSRDLNAARVAYNSRDIDASKRAHRPAKDDDASDLEELFVNHTEAHPLTSGEYLKAFVFGGLDGIVTVFAIVAGCVGAQLKPSQIVIVGLGNLLADAFSMGFGEYVSARAEEDYIEGEKKRELWEIDMCPDEEKNEMMEIYEKKYGFTESDATQMVNLAFQYPAFFLSHMMTEELGILPDNVDGPSPFRRGLVMFCSFAVCGVLPLLGYVAFLLFLKDIGSDNTYSAFLFSCGVVLFSLFILGIAKANFSGQKPLKSGIIMCLNGAIASTLAYGIGSFLQRTFNT